jgi:exoribonuclease R
MNRKNRLAALASSASVQFNTFQYFKDRPKTLEDSIVMRVTRTGIYIMVQKYGIEGLLHESEETTIAYDPDNEVTITITY